jgi:hypothetical protein
MVADARKTATISGLEVLEAVDADGNPFTADDLRAAALNFSDFRHLIEPPFVVGHEEDQPLAGGLSNTGIPAFGWVDRMDVVEQADRNGRVRPVLVTDVQDVHAGLADLIARKAYRKVSAEMWRRPPAACFSSRQELLDVLRRRGHDPDALLAEAEDWAPFEHARLSALKEAGRLKRVPPPEWLVDYRLRGPLGAMARRVAALGGEVPRIATLRDIPDAVFSMRALGAARDARTIREEYGDETFEVFMAAATEEPAVSTADAKRAKLETSLKKIGWSDDLISALEAVPGSKLQNVVLAALEQAAGVHDTPVDAGAAADTAATDTAAMTEPTPGQDGLPDAETMIADLVALGEDEADLRAMDPADLAALWQEMKGTTMSHRTHTGRVATPKPSAAFAAKMADLDRQIEEARKAVAETNRLAVANRDERRREAAETRKATVAALAKRWADDYFVLPTEVDPGSKTPNLFHRLMAADGETVKKFGATESTDFDAAVAEIEARGPGWARRNARELIPDPQGGAPDDLDKQVDEFAARRNKLLQRRDA